MCHRERRYPELLGCVRSGCGRYIVVVHFVPAGQQPSAQWPGPSLTKLVDVHTCTDVPNVQVRMNGASPPSPAACLASRMSAPDGTTPVLLRALAP